MNARWKSRRHGRAGVIGLLAVTVLAVLAQGAAAQTRRAPVRGGDTVWSASWEASPEPQRVGSSGPLNLTNQTVRQIARITLGGLYIRIQLSNEFGDHPLVVGAAHVALAAGAGAATQPGSDVPVTFSGEPGVTIPVGARMLSDPISLKVAPLSQIAVSVYFPSTVGAPTLHYFSGQSSYMASGDLTAAPDMPGASATTTTAVLTGIDVSTPVKNQVVVTLGDSLTTGFGSKVGANHSWPDLLAERLLARKDGPALGVVNAAIGGNRLLHDYFGPNALSRFDRDVLAEPNAGYLIILLGINDFGLPASHNLPDEEVSYQEVITGYKQMIERAHSYGIRVFIATLPPFGPIPGRPGYYSEASQAKRVAINQWIMGQKGFEGVIDFDGALRDPKSPNRLNPAFDSGDHLDPNDAGYKAMAAAIPARLFE